MSCNRVFLTQVRIWKPECESTHVTHTEYDRTKSNILFLKDISWEMFNNWLNEDSIFQLKWIVSVSKANVRIWKPKRGSTYEISIGCNRTKSKVFIFKRN